MQILVYTVLPDRLDAPAGRRSAFSSAPLYLVAAVVLGARFLAARRSTPALVPASRAARHDVLILFSLALPGAPVRRGGARPGAPLMRSRARTPEPPLRLGALRALLADLRGHDPRRSSVPATGLILGSTPQELHPDLHVSVGAVSPDLHLGPPSSPTRRTRSRSPSFRSTWPRTSRRSPTCHPGDRCRPRGRGRPASRTRLPRSGSRDAFFGEEDGVNGRGPHVAGSSTRSRAHAQLRRAASRCGRR